MAPWYPTGVLGSLQWIIRFPEYLQVGLGLPQDSCLAFFIFLVQRELQNTTPR
jgi:hypothetical protein